MSLLQSKLANDPKYTQIANDLNTLMHRGRTLGAIEGPQRVELICEEYKHLSPNTAYLWLDPASFQREIEDAQIHTPWLERMHVVRNILSLAPLIATWFALFTAMTAYQRYLSVADSDKGASIMALWQTGFQGQTWLTFTFAAGLDVLLLFLYLLSILLVHEMERRAYACAVNYTRTLQGKIEELVKCIATEGLTHVGDQADIDKVVDSVKDVVAKASSAMQQNIDNTTKLLTEFVTKASNAMQQNISDTTKLLTLHIDKANDANTNAIKRLEQSVQTHETHTQTSIKQITDAATQALNGANQKIELLFTQKVVPMMTDFHQDMSTLHTELGKYQGRLDGLTTASQQLATASQGLMQASQSIVDNAERYTTIGQDINAQIASLNTTQQEVLSQIQMVAGGITTAAGSMNTATTNMVNATKRVETMTTQIDTNTRNTIQAMTQGVEQATRGIAYIGPRMEQVAHHLEQASYRLEVIGLPWLFRRRQTYKQPQPPNGKPQNAPGAQAQSGNTGPQGRS